MRIVNGAALVGALILFGLCLTAGVWAGQKANGTLTAEKTCPAYQSMRRKTNPGDVHLVQGAQYPVFEINPRPEGVWHRIRVVRANPSERWVAPGCGSVELEPTVLGGDRDCRTPDRYDSFVLAVSWQPAFCETHSGKPECEVSDASAYQASNFTLHGLWPNRKQCDTRYGYCGEQRESWGGFCSYPELALNPWVRRSVNVVMPSAAAGSCLQRHQWYKHGSCQTKWTKDQYFAIAAQLTMAFNGSGMGAYMAANLGKEISRDDLHAQIDSIFGAGAHRRMQLYCKNANLMEIRIHLPDVISKSDTLTSLIMRSQAREKNGNCPDEFGVDPIGQ